MFGFRYSGPGSFAARPFSLSKIIFNGGRRGAGPRGAALPQDLAGLIAKTSLDGTVYSWCPSADGFALALIGTREPRYVVLHGDGRTETLAPYKGSPELTGYSRREAEKLDASIKASETIQGSVTPRWNTTVICGFIEPTAALCWQYSPTERAFVGIGGWTT